MSAERDLIVKALPGYELGRELGRGAFGVVIAAKHRELSRPVAIKQLNSAAARGENVLSRFQAEARFLASLNHPHIVPIYDYVEYNGLCLLIMEHLEGGKIAITGARESDREDACAATLSLSVALQYAHTRRVLHRDVKPANLLVSGEGVVKVSDFGIAKVIGGAGHANKTRTGDFLGTPAYMSPEQAGGRALTPQTDVYSSGLILYKFLSGRLPYPHDGNALSILYRHVHDDPEHLKTVEPGIPEPLAEVVMRAIARDPADRYVSAEAFATDLAIVANLIFGPGWATRAKFPIMAPGPILSILQQGQDLGALVPKQSAAELLASRQFDPPRVAASQATDDPSRAVANRTTGGSRRKRRILRTVGISCVAVALIFVALRVAGSTDDGGSSDFAYREELIFMDTFDDPAVGWEQYESPQDGGIDRGVTRDGRYRVSVARPDFVHISDTTFPGPAARPELVRLTDVVVEVDALDASDSGAVFGMACRVSDGRAYVGVVNRRGFWGVYRANREGFETLIRGEVGHLAQTGRANESLHVRMECTDGADETQTRIRLHLERSLVADVKDAAGSRTGAVGLVVATGSTSGGADVFFDNFVVKTLGARQ